MSDLISRSALIEAIVNTPTNVNWYSNGYMNGCATRQLEILDIIDKLPTVEAKPVVHGEWIEIKYHTWECSVCSFHPFKGYIPKEPNFNFCPNCGAYMAKPELVVPVEMIKEAILKNLDQKQKEMLFFGKKVE